MEVSGTTNSTPTENVSVEVHLGALCQTLSDQCWAVLGLCWAHVGPMLGHLGGWPGQGSLSQRFKFIV